MHAQNQTIMYKHNSHQCVSTATPVNTRTHTATCNVMGTAVHTVLRLQALTLQIHLQFYIPYSYVLPIQGLTNKYLD